MRTAQKILSVLLACFFIVAGTVSSLGKTAYADETEGVINDVGHFVICKVFPFEGVSEFLYKASFTDLIPFLLRSKSFASGAFDDVDSFYNSILDIGKKENKSELNYPIIGYYPNIPMIEEGGSTATAKEGFEANGGPALTPYQRFGVSGLTFTNYMGEWKYVDIDVCAETASPNGSNAWYDGRQQPEASWSSKLRSQDPRTLQIRPTGEEINTYVLTNIPRFLLWIAKTGFVATMGYIKLAFSDLGAMTGIDEVAYGDGNKGSGVMGALFSSIYIPLIGLIFVISACQLIWIGIVKRQYRAAWGQLARSFAAFFISIFIFVNPTVAISLPNNIAVAGQALIMSAMSGSVGKGGVICSTTSEELAPTDVSLGDYEVDLDSADSGYSLLEEAGNTITDSIGCALWELTLFQPWARAQFGDEWYNLYSKGNALSGGKSINNSDDNAEIVGDAAVPLGGGRVINNWALFQLSTQTNAHAKSDLSGEKPTHNSGYNDEIYRVVDALSNVYIEKVESKLPEAENVEHFEVRQEAQDALYPHWAIWAGDVQGHRSSVMFEAVILNGALVLPVFILAFITAMLSIAVILLVSFLPIFLLFGSMGSRGQDIMMGYLDVLLNNVMRRIIAGALLMLSIIMMGLAMDWLQHRSFGQGLVFIILIALAIKKLWNKVIDWLASFSFSNSGAAFLGVNKRIADNFKNGAKIVGGIGFSATAGAASGKLRGAGARAGAKVAVRGAVENELYRHKLTRPAYMIAKRNTNERMGDLGAHESHCSDCGRPMAQFAGQMGALLDEGGSLCPLCMDDHDSSEYNEEVIPENIKSSRISNPDDSAVPVIPYDQTDSAYNMRAKAAQTAPYLDEEDRKILCATLIADIASTLADAAADISNNNVPSYVADLSLNEGGGTNNLYRMWKDAKSGNDSTSSAPVNFSNNFLRPAEGLITNDIMMIFPEADRTAIQAEISKSLRDEFQKRGVS